MLRGAQEALCNLCFKLICPVEFFYGLNRPVLAGVMRAMMRQALPGCEPGNFQHRCVAVVCSQ